MFEGIKNLMKRWGAPATQYQPGTGRIVAARTDSGAGVNMTAETALSIPAIFHGLRTFGQVIGAREWNVVHHLTSNVGGVEHRRQEIARNHPVHALLHSEPNEFQNASEWRECMVAHSILTGNGFSYIERNGNFRPTALLPLLPERTRAVVTNGKLSYQTMVNGQPFTLDPWEVFHVKGFSWDGVSGMPLWRIMRDTLGLDKAQTEFASKFYSHGANMGGVFTYSGALTGVARQNIKSSIEREYGGIGNAFRTLFLEEGMKWEKTTVDPDKAQFIEGREYSLGELSRVIGLPPHILYNLSESTNNNIEHQGISAVVYSFEPLTNKLCQEANRKLLYDSEKNDYETKIDLKPLQQGDKLSQAQVDQIRFNNLALTPNEIRAEDGRNPIEGGDSVFLNTALLPLAVAIAKAMAPAPGASPVTPPTTGSTVQPVPGVDTEADEDDDTPPAPQGTGVEPADGIPGPQVPAELVPDSPDRSAAVAPVVRDAVARVVRREVKAVGAALGKLDVEAFRTWFQSWQSGSGDHVAEILGPALDTARALGLDVAADYARRHVEQTATDVELVLSAPDDQRPDAIWDLTSRWAEDRAIAATTYILKGPHE